MDMDMRIYACMQWPIKVAATYNELQHESLSLSLSLTLTLTLTLSLTPYPYIRTWPHSLPLRATWLSTWASDVGGHCASL